MAPHKRALWFYCFADDDDGWFCLYQSILSSLYSHMLLHTCQDIEVFICSSRQCLPLLIWQMCDQEAVLMNSKSFIQAVILHIAGFYVDFNYLKVVVQHVSLLDITFSLCQPNDVEDDLL